MRAADQASPQLLVTSVRLDDSPLVLNPLAYQVELSVHAQWLLLQPLQQIGTALFALVRHCQSTGDWKCDQGLRFDLAKQPAWMGTLIALVELADSCDKIDAGD